VSSSGPVKVRRAEGFVAGGCWLRQPLGGVGVEAIACTVRRTPVPLAEPKRLLL